MPPSTTIAPIAMMIAEFPVRPLPDPAVVLVVIVGAAVVVVGIETLGCGKPGERGLPLGDCAAAAGGSASATPRSAATTTRIVFNGVPYASGCSIAGVSGART